MFTVQSSTDTHAVAVEQALDAPPLELQFRSRRTLTVLFVACVCIEIAFVALDYWVNYSRAVEAGPIRRLFNITREDGLASWFAITQTVLLALTLWALWLITRRAGARWTSRGWLVLATLFTYMAMDDGATIHERIGSTLKASGSGEAASWFPSYGWQIIFVPVFAVMGAFMLGFLWRQLGRPRQRLAVVLALGAMAMAVTLDFFEGLKPDHPWNLHTALAQRWDFANFARTQFDQTEYATLLHFGKSLEETLEMLAITLLWTAILSHSMRVGRDVRVRFTSD